jgi:endonuclease/exonuclease/phosphatase family metal-dependent hydrolase
VTHLTNSDPEINLPQAESLMIFVASRDDDAAILAGDFNATVDSPQIQTITRQTVDTYRVAHAEDGGSACCLENPSSGRREHLDKRIDHVFLFVSPGTDVRVLDCDLVLNEPFPSLRGWLWLSDHVGLMATLVIDQ